MLKGSGGMKLSGAYIFHLCMAVLAVPGLTVFSAGLGYSWIGHFFSADKSPQAFYSDHLLLAATLVGLLLAYTVCDMLTDRGAVWVWVPFTLVFLVRVLTWKESVLFHSSILDHFFTNDCQIQDWRDPTFASRCADKLFLTQVFVGALAYSCGALVHRFMRRPTLRAGRFSST